MQLLGDGNEAAFTRLYHGCYAELFLLARRMVGDAAADVVADVFMQVWTKFPKLEGPQFLVAYLRAMVRNRALYVLKQEGRQEMTISELAFLSDKAYEEEYFREIIESRLFALIHYEIEQLTPHMREVFKLAYIEGLTNAEIAERLGMSNAAVRVRKSEALQQLRSAMYHVELVVLVKLMVVGIA